MNLIARIKALVAEEKRVTAEILRLLLQVEDEKIFALRGYSSLFELCVKELGYSEAAAYRRVSAARLQRREPGCIEKIASGELSLSAAALVETVFRQARKKRVVISEARKKELFRAALGRVSREAQARVASTAAAMGVVLPRREAPFSSAVEEKLARLQALRSHSDPGATKEELLHRILDEALERQLKKQGDIAAEVKFPAKRKVPEKVKRAIFQRDRFQCTYEDPLTGRRCESRHFLEIDHIEPLALGGKTAADNLRLLCRTHNRL